MSDPMQQRSHEHEYVPGDFANPELEDDETIAPRPEEEVADALRTERDIGGGKQGTD